MSFFQGVIAEKRILNDLKSVFWKNGSFPWLFLLSPPVRFYVVFQPLFPMIWTYMTYDICQYMQSCMYEYKNAAYRIIYIDQTNYNYILSELEID